MWRKLSEIKDLDVFRITEKPEEITDAGKDDRVSEKLDFLKAELIKLREAEAQARVFSEYEHRSLREAVEALSDDKDYVRELMVEYLLCIADGLEAGVRAGEAISSVEIQIWLDGIRVVHQRVMELLAKLGVHPIHSEGKLFDPIDFEANPTDASASTTSAAEPEVETPAEPAEKATTPPPAEEGPAPAPAEPPAATPEAEEPPQTKEAPETPPEADSATPEETSFLNPRRAYEQPKLMLTPVLGAESTGFGLTVFF